jgi:hypothetical protein
MNVLKTGSSVSHTCASPCPSLLHALDRAARC